MTPGLDELLPDAVEPSTPLCLRCDDNLCVKLEEHRAELKAKDTEIRELRQALLELRSPITKQIGH